MSLEAVIAENTATMRDLIAALTLSAVTTVTEVKAEPKAKAATKVEAKVVEPVVEEPAAEVVEEVQAEVAAEETTEQPTYAEAAKAITDLGQAKGRDAAIAVLAQFKLKKLPDAKPEQFAEIIAAAKAA